MADAAGRRRDPLAAKRREFYLRVVSAAVLIPIVLVATWVGGWLFGLLIVAVAALVMVEWCDITGHSRAPALDWVAGMIVVAALITCLLGAPRLGAAFLAAGVALALLGRLGGICSRWLALGILYAGLSGGALILLRGGDSGFAAIVFLFAVIWVSDIAAYFVGRTVGGPKLWPAVSPNKTWSGAIGGLVGGAAAGTATAAAAGYGPAAGLVAVAAVISVAGQAGDLAESSLKRRFGKKDSGTIIPGHGGVMDRVDALVIGALVATVVGVLRTGWQDPGSGLFIW